jgi:superfamily II DNA or RNA helicase
MSWTIISPPRVPTMRADEVKEVVAELDRPAREALWALSVAFHALGRRQLGEVMDRAGLLPLSEQALERLLGAGLATETHQGVACIPEARELASKEALEAGLFAPTATAIQALYPGAPISPRGQLPHLPWDEIRLRAGRDLRIALLTEDRAALSRPASAYGDLFEWLHARTEAWEQPVPFATLIPSDYAAQWALRDLAHGILHWRLRPELREVARRVAPLGSDELRRGVALDALLMGEDPELGPEDEPHWLALAALRAFIHGSSEEALARFDVAVKAMRKPIGKRNADLPGVLGMFHLLALAVADTPKHSDKIGKIVGRQSTNWRLYPALKMLAALSELEEPDDYAGELLSEELADPWASWIATLAILWRDGPQTTHHLRPCLDALEARAKLAGWTWLAGECRAERELLRGRHVRDSALVQRRRHKGRWELALAELERLGAEAQPEAQPVVKERLTWRVEVRSGELAVGPYLQRRSARGWSAGKAVALANLRHSHKYLTEQDQRVAESFRWGTHSLIFDRDAALQLVGHPLLFDAHDPHQRIELVRGDIHLRVERQEDGWLVCCEPWCPDAAWFAMRQGVGRIVLYDLDERRRDLLRIVGPEGLTLPEDQAERLAKVTGDLVALVPVESELASDARATRVEVDPRLYVQLRRRGERMRVDVRVRPLGNDGPWLTPGAGGVRVMARIDGEEREAVRDLDAERAALDALVARCPTVAALERSDEPFWVETLEGMVELVAALAAAGEAVVVEWHEGEPVRVRGGAVGSEGLQVRVTTADQWLEARGQVALEDGAVVTLAELFRARPVGRFIELAGGDFIAVTEELKRELASLEAFAMDAPDGEVRLHPVAVHLLDPLADAIGSLELDEDVRARAARVREAHAEVPAVPRALQAELRSYQLDGFRWLARTIEWGAGACLADDMGLGKTVQLLALLLRRAAHGPALVVAPLSVGSAWSEQARRFAPTLRIVGLAEAGDRAATVAALGEGDVLLVSYGLLVREDELLASRSFATLVLDEAQAIKNAVAKRARAAHALQGEARIVATGTPIENRLTELWSLFRFLNPGLLGTLRDFTRHYARPIERNGDRRALERLRRRIRPFILRRTKSEVLDELPPRTEVVHRIEAPPEEAVIYEGIRVAALADLEAAKKRGPDGEDLRFAILAALTRLRRACCHPSLAAPDCGLPGAKLRSFVSLTRDLVDAGHRVLVFSQFVDVLTLARNALRVAELSCQYLDGSTPAKQRAERVHAFQRGEGDAFLISTKAGGQGITLTAADYVIHLDPWWNPAVEDQASDRAHRIGQTRPVTVIRLVMAGTIEETILELHAKKRDLADQLLDGAGTAAQLGVDELMNLLRKDD